MTTYTMKNCGCRLEMNELITVNGRYMCPHHSKNGIDFIEKPCIDCDTIMRVLPQRSHTIRCPECRVKQKRIIDKQAGDRWRAGKTEDRLKLIAKKQNAANQAWDCVHRRHCMDDFLAKKKTDPFLPCYGCLRYVTDHDVVLHDKYNVSKTEAKATI